MNKSLNPKANYLMIAVWLTALCAGLIRSGMSAAVVVIATSVLGTFAGLLQAKALKQSPESFAQAETAMEVRRAMASTKPGKASILVSWLMALTTVGVVLAAKPAQPLAVFLAAYASFAFAREVVALPALKDLVASFGHT